MVRMTHVTLFLKKTKEEVFPNCLASIGSGFLSVKRDSNGNKTNGEIPLFFLP